MELILGIDGGGSKTSFILSDRNGNILANHIGGSSDFRAVGKEPLFATISATMKMMLSKLNATVDQIVSVCAGIPCYGEYRDWDAVCDLAFSNIFPKALIHCVNDVEVGMYGSLALKSGVHIVSGTGSIVIGMDANANIARCGGWSEKYSDEGSCYWLGLKACELFSKQVDGRLPKAALYEIVRKRFNIVNDMDFIKIADNEILCNRKSVANMQMALNQAAMWGDISAIKAYESAANELSLCVKGVIERLQLTSPAVSYSGGLFHSGEFILFPLRKNLAGMDASLSTPILPPDKGAVLYGISLIGGKDLDGIIKNLAAWEGNND